MPKNEKNNDARRLGRIVKRRLRDNKKDGGTMFANVARRSIAEAKPDLAAAAAVLQGVPALIDTALSGVPQALQTMLLFSDLTLSLAGDIGEGWDKATIEQRLVASLTELGHLSSKISEYRRRTEALESEVIETRFDEDNPYEPIQRTITLYGEPGLSDVVGKVIADVALALDEINDDMWGDAIDALPQFAEEDEVDIMELSTDSILELLGAMLGDHTDEDAEKIILTPTAGGSKQWAGSRTRLGLVIEGAVQTAAQVISHLIVDCMTSPGMITRWAESYSARPQGGIFAGLSGGALEAVEGWSPDKILMRRVSKQVKAAVAFVFEVSFGMKVLPPWSGQLVSAFSGILVQHAAYAAATIPDLCVDASVPEVAQQDPSGETIREPEPEDRLTTDDLDALFMKMISDGIKKITVLDLCAVVADAYGSFFAEDILSLLDECITLHTVFEGRDGKVIKFYFADEDGATAKTIDLPVSQVDDGASDYKPYHEIDEPDEPDEPDEEPEVKLTAREQGASAYGIGAAKSDCPWRRSHPNAKKWIRGWENARKAAKKVEQSDPVSVEQVQNEQSHDSDVQQNASIAPSTVEEFFDEYSTYLPDFDTLEAFHLSVLPVMLAPVFEGSKDHQVAINEVRAAFGLNSVTVVAEGLEEPDDEYSTYQPALDEDLNVCECGASEPVSADTFSIMEDSETGDRSRICTACAGSIMASEGEDEEGEDEDDERTAEDIADEILSDINAPKLSDLRRLKPRNKYRSIAKQIVRLASDHLTDEAELEATTNLITELARKYELVPEDVVEQYTVSENNKGAVTITAKNDGDDEVAYEAAVAYKKNHPEIAVTICSHDGESFTVDPE